MRPTSKNNLKKSIKKNIAGSLASHLAVVSDDFDFYFFYFFLLETKIRLTNSGVEKKLRKLVRQCTKSEEPRIDVDTQGPWKV